MALGFVFGLVRRGRGSVLADLRAREERVRVEVVGENRPAGPDLFALGAAQPAAAEPVAAFQVRDASFDSGAVAAESSSCSFRAGLGAAVRRRVAGTTTHSA